MQYLVISRTILAELGISLNTSNRINEDSVDQVVLDKAVLQHGRWLYRNRAGELQKFDRTDDIHIGMRLAISESDIIFDHSIFHDPMVGDSTLTMTELISVNVGLLTAKARESHSFKSDGTYRRGWMPQQVDGEVWLCRCAELEAVDLDHHSPAR